MLNKFFTNIGSTINSKIERVLLNDYPPLYYPPMLDLKPITKTEISQAINMLSASSSGYDEIMAMNIKVAKTELLPVLEYIFKRVSNQTLSLRHGNRPKLRIYSKQGTLVITDPLVYCQP